VLRGRSPLKITLSVIQPASTGEPDKKVAQSSALIAELKPARRRRTPRATTRTPRKLVNRQLTVPLQSRQQQRNDRLQPLRAQPVRNLPEHDQRLLDLYTIPSMDALLHPSAIADLWPQQPDCVLRVIA
jgi:hypothetical protein